jgi:polyhydroxyalkanoate synthesis regulator phasin
MKKIVKLTESDLVRIVNRIISEDESETEVEITGKPQDILNQYEKLKKQFNEKQQNLIEIYNQILQPLKNEVNELKSEIESFEKTYIPRVFISEVEDKVRGKKYLRGVVRYYIEGSDRQQSTTIHLGKSSDYALGVDDPELQRVAMLKAMDFVIRKKGL